jgi:hypothetical protein
MPLDLEVFRVRGSAPHDLSALYLVPDFVEEDEEERLTRQVAAGRSSWVQVGRERGPRGLEAAVRHTSASAAWLA